jgi:hypothetical protein
MNEKQREQEHPCAFLAHEFLQVIDLAYLSTPSIIGAMEKRKGENCVMFP